MPVLHAAPVQPSCNSVTCTDLGNILPAGTSVKWITQVGVFSGPVRRFITDPAAPNLLMQIGQFRRSTRVLAVVSGCFATQPFPSEIPGSALLTCTCLSCRFFLQRSFSFLKTKTGGINPKPGELKAQLQSDICKADVTGMPQSHFTNRVVSV